MTWALRVIATWCTYALMADAADPEKDIETMVFAAQKVSKKKLQMLKKNLQNRNTDGRFCKVTRVRGRDGIQSYKQVDFVTHDTRGVIATGLSLRIISKDNVFVECAGPSGPEYIRSGTFVQDAEGRLALYTKPDIFLVDTDQNIIHTDQSPEICNGYVTQYVDGQKVVLATLRVREASQVQALAGNTWRLINPTTPHRRRYQVAGGQVSQGGQDTASVFSESENTRRSVALGVALLRED